MKELKRTLLSFCRDEPTRQAWLLKELNEKRPLLPLVAGSNERGGYASLGVMFDETVCDVLDTFDAIAEIPEESLGARSAFLEPFFG